MLLTSNLLGGVGVASGIAVGSLLVEQLGATSLAGFAQALSVLGAAVAAVPLAGLAARRGRRWSLTVGYGVAVAGAGLVLLGAATGMLLVLLLGLTGFGVAQATNLQARYAAGDGVPAASRGRMIALVVWATTIGSVAGPNLTGLGQAAGEPLGLPGLAGPYLFSVAAFALAGIVLGLGYRARPTEAPVVVGLPVAPVGSLAALRWAWGHPQARFAVVLIAAAHAVMVMVMAMTPVHMRHEGATLEVVGVVISAHIAGMYALSPVFGWLTDRIGPLRAAGVGLGALAAAVTLGFTGAALDLGDGFTAAALVVLGLGWSACTISGAALVSASASDEVRVPLQGGADATMSYAGAAAAVLAGPLLAIGGFRLVNLVAAALLAPVLLALAAARRAPSVVRLDDVAPEPAELGPADL
ncbi:MFS transporter [Rhodococcus aerolatus]